MINKNHRFLNLFVVLGCYLSTFAWAFGASQEIRTASQLAGTIVAPMEARKLALSSGDKIYVSLNNVRPVKKGDVLEIFQQTSLPADGQKKELYFAKVGQAVVLEIINERLLLCMIDSTKREIAVGDHIYFPEN